MSSTVTYSIANDDDDDELLTFAERGDEVMVDTSAGVTSAEELPEVSEDLDALTEASYAGKTKNHRRCLWIVIPVLLFAAVGATVGIITNVNKRTSVAPALPEFSTSSKVPTFTVHVLNSSKHDRKAFTQGLEYHNGFFYESTGIRGHSSLRKVNISTGEVVQKHLLDENIFGEGLTLHKDHHIFMLSWKAGRGFIFHQKTFKLLKEWQYEGQGWGLTMDDAENEVYMSDGTTQLRVLEPEQLSELRRINVTLRGKPVSNLNEIEWVCGEIWANVWLSKDIYRISPKTGAVLSIIDASNLPLEKDETIHQDVLNGIAYDKDTGRVWFTGKLWSTVYQVALNDASIDLKTCNQTAK